MSTIIERVPELKLRASDLSEQLLPELAKYHAIAVRCSSGGSSGNSLPSMSGGDYLPFCTHRVCCTWPSGI